MISGVNDMFMFTAVLSVMITAVMLVIVVYESRSIDERFRDFRRRDIRDNIPK